MTILKNFIKRLKQEETSKPRLLPSSIKVNTDPFQTWSDDLSKIGEGAYGFIYKSQKKNSSDIAALKKIQYESEDELHDLLIEIFLEFCSHGSIDSIIQHLEKPLNENQIKFITKYTLEALIYLHDNLIIHRDLKAGNILINEYYEVKLVDFGVSARLSSENGRRDSFTGTPYWMAPEVISCETSKDYPYNQLADIWSFGITIIEMAEMRPPHQELNPNRVLMRIRKADPPSLINPTNWSESMKEFLSNCLKKNPEERKSAKELSRLSFVSKVQEEDKYHLKILVAEFGADVEEEIEEISVDKIPSPDKGIILSHDAEILLKNVKEDSMLITEEKAEEDNNKSKLKSPLTLNTSINTNHSHNSNEQMSSITVQLSKEIYSSLLEEVIMDEHVNPSIPGCVFEVMYELDQTQSNEYSRLSKFSDKTKKSKPPLPPARVQLTKKPSSSLSTDRHNNNISQEAFSSSQPNQLIKTAKGLHANNKSSSIDKGLPIKKSTKGHNKISRKKIDD